MQHNDNDNGGEAERSAWEPLASPISAADMLTRSLRRTPRRQATPPRKLFPDDLELVAPGMTPSSRNQGRRKSARLSQTPGRDENRLRLSLAAASQVQTPASSSSRPLRGRSSDAVPALVGRRHQLTTPRSKIPEEQAFAPVTPRSSTTAGKRRARNTDESSETSRKAAAFGGWGQTREESPMDLLRRLATAPGRLFSPTEEEKEAVPSITQSLSSAQDAAETTRSIRQSLTFARFPPRVSSFESEDESVRTSSQATFRQSVANTSIAPSEAGQVRRAGRRSSARNIFSDILGQDSSMFQSNTSPMRPQAFSVRGETSEYYRSGDRSLPLSSAEGYGRETELEGRLSSDGLRLDDAFPDVTNRLENIRSSGNSDEDDFPFYERGDAGGNSDMEVESTLIFGPGESPQDRNEKDRQNGVRDNSTSSAISAPATGSEVPMRIDSSVHDFAADVGNVPSSEGFDQQIAFDDGPVNDQPSPDEGYGDDDDDGSDDETLNQEQELRAARQNLLRKRREKKKAKRFSPVTGHAVPSLPTQLVRSLFSSFVSPNTTVSSSLPGKAKTSVERRATEAVEDLSHHFFAQFTQALVTQTEKQKGRTTIAEKDVIALLKSQGKVSARHSIGFLARRHLPRELSDLITSTTNTAALDASEVGKKRRPPKRKTIAIADTVSRSSDSASRESS